MEIGIYELTMGIILAFGIGFFVGAFAAAKTIPQLKTKKKKEPIEGYS